MGEKKSEASRAPAIELGPADGPGSVEIETQAQEPKTANQVILHAFAASGNIAAKVMKVIEEGFTATRPQFNKATQGWDEIPDYKTRQAAVECYLAHTIGLPVQKTENLNLTGKLPGSERRRPPGPAVLAYYQRELDKAKRQKLGGSKPGDASPV